jgi:hypothetical protein
LTAAQHFACQLYSVGESCLVFVVTVYCAADIAGDGAAYSSWPGQVAPCASLHCLEHKYIATLVEYWMGAPAGHVMRPPLLLLLLLLQRCGSSVCYAAQSAIGYCSM